MSLTQALHRSAQQKPDELYSICAGRTFTHQEALDRVSRIAGGLCALGVKPEDKVAILAQNSDLYLQCILATAWADALIVPVNTRWNRAEIADSLDEAGVGVLIVDDAFVELGHLLVSDVPGIAALVYAGAGESVDGLPSIDQMATDGPVIADAHRCGDQPLGLFYTGGTTGRSRGVVLSHNAVVTSALGFAAMRTIGTESVCMVSAPLFHLAQFSGWVAAALVGATQVVLPAFDPVAVMRLIQDHRITRAVLVPTMLHAVLNHPKAGDFDLSSLETVVYGGSPIAQATLDHAREFLPAAGFLQVYGMTEMAAVVTTLLPEDHVGDLTKSAGRAAPHALIRVLDPGSGRELPIGSVGEVVVQGANMMTEYWRRPEETAGVIRGGWLHTGDAGYLDERGYLFIVDRVKDMIVSGGENVYSVEVENAVAKHPAVSQVAVIGVPDDKWGERVHAIVVLRPEMSLELGELQNSCRQTIAGYKCPRSMTVVDSLPISPAGKILKRDLRKEFDALSLQR
ncbi:AMP-binding protein [Gordonia amarae]|uniref:AMP-binding protein n=2 Tax=Gordonia amarae TaxID=36821 RepID=A0A857KIZ7_9ACTN|nr:AMP-binding protein [Gordonia amarae]QHN17162.1 AMP-binding protein [Gordonia amarae]QHN21688.1 AMP-binding protein [Gordonia amarae]QHN30540.1 AMP-binding protein [Gordonia amarae]QHN39316.1 AMP-binding protein [Gordonia amarae]